MKNILLLITFCFAFAFSSVAQTIQITETHANACINNDGAVTLNFAGGPTPQLEDTLYLQYLVRYDSTAYWTYNQQMSYTGNQSLISRLYPGLYRAFILEGWGPISDTVYFTIGGFIDSDSIVIDKTPAYCPLSNGTISLSSLVGAGPFSYSWTNGAVTQNVSNLDNGTYGVTISNNAGCLYQINNIVVEDFSSIDLSMNLPTPTSCINATAIVTPTGGTQPYTYSWSTFPVQTNDTAIDLRANYSYKVFVTDVNGCTNDTSIYIAPIYQFNVNHNSTNEHCNDANGTITAYASGGTAPYQFNWNNGETTNYIDSLTSGSYLLRVTDAKGCVRNYNAYISKSSPVSAYVSSSTPSLCTSPTGQLTITASGGTNPYDIVWNTNPPATGATLSNVAPGNYTVTIIDAEGCKASVQTTVSDNSSLAIEISSKGPETCNASDGYINTVTTGGISPYTYSWSNNEYTANLSNIHTGCYRVLVTDANNCQRTINTNVGQISPVYISAQITPASCILTPDGAVNITVHNATAPIQYYWSNGETSEDISALYPSRYPKYLNPYYNYHVNVSDANGCYAHLYNYVNYLSEDTCAVTISGKVFHDNNLTCDYELVDSPISNMPIKFSSGDYLYSANQSGNFSLVTRPGNYTVQQMVNSYTYDYNSYHFFDEYCNEGLQTVSLYVGGQSANIMYADTTPYGTDLLVKLNSVDAAQRGFIHHQYVSITNRGGKSVNAEVVVKFPNIIQVTGLINNFDWYSSSNFYLTSIASDSIVINADGLNAGTTYKGWISYYIPQSTLLGQQLDFRAIAQPQSTDLSPTDNVQDWQTQVVGSYDPNSVEVTPRGAGSTGDIFVSDSILTYTIHFQNTGTYQTNFVQLVDTLDNNMNLDTFIPLCASDQNYTLSISPERILTVYFPYMHLQPKEMDEIKSMGFFSFKVKTKRNINTGDQIKSRANIYFDYNEAIVTNQAISTIVEASGFDNYSLAENLKVYPNPNNGNFRIEFKNGTVNKKISLYNIEGRLIYEAIVKDKTFYEYSNTHLAPGIYVLQVTDENGVTDHQKVIVTKK